VGGGFVFVPYAVRSGGVRSGGRVGFVRRRLGGVPCRWGWLVEWWAVGCVVGGDGVPQVGTVVTVQRDGGGGGVGGVDVCFCWLVGRIQGVVVYGFGGATERPRGAPPCTGAYVRWGRGAPGYVACVPCGG